MAKIITGKELLQIAATAPKALPPKQYEEFVRDLAGLVTAHFGGRVGLVQYVEEDLNDVTAAISQDGSIPEDGGAYKDYDPDGEL
jgi:hypothetical protein